MFLRRESEIKGVRGHFMRFAVDRVQRLSVVYVGDLETKLLVFGKAHSGTAKTFSDLQEHNIVQPYRFHKITMIDMKTFGLRRFFHNVSFSLFLHYNSSFSKNQEKRRGNL